MPNRCRKLPTAKIRYYVEEPLIMLPIGEYEQLVNHLTSLSHIDQYEPRQASVLRQQHRLLLVATRQKLNEAKAYYQRKEPLTEDGQQN